MRNKDIFTYEQLKIIDERILYAQRLALLKSIEAGDEIKLDGLVYTVKSINFFDGIYYAGYNMVLEIGGQTCTKFLRAADTIFPQIIIKSKTPS